MSRIDGPAIVIDIRQPAAQLFPFLLLIVTVQAERLQRAEKELVDVSVVLLDVISNGRCGSYPVAQT